MVSDSSGHPAVSTVTSTELGYLDGVTSAIQTQLNGKAAINHTHSYLPLSGGTLTGTVTSRSLAAAADSTYDIGTSSVRYRNIYADNLYGTVQGSVASANQLTTARTISLAGDVTMLVPSLFRVLNLLIPMLNFGFKLKIEGGI